MSKVGEAFKVFGSRRVWLLVALGFASGLPIKLVWDTLAAWLKTSGVDLTTIGLFSVALTPYSFKFLWSPLMDRFRLPWLGRRRGWLLLTQVSLAFCFVAMPWVGPKRAFPLGLVTLLTAFLSASQDIVSDAYRTDILSENERAAGTATFVLGYRVAMLIAGAVALFLAPTVGWTAVYSGMAPLMLVGVLATWLAPEPEVESPRTLGAAVVQPFVEFLSRKGAGLALLFIVLARASEYLGTGSMLTPFLIETGFTLREIGAINKLWGLIATMFGAFLAGVLLPKVGMRRSLLGFGLLQAVTNAAYLLLALTGRNLAVMIGAIAIHNVTVGLADGALVTFQMALCNKRFSATQYALLSSLGAVTRVAFGAPSGALATAVGWPWFWGTAILAGLPALLVLAMLEPATVEAAAPPLPTAAANP